MSELVVDVRALSHRHKPSFVSETYRCIDAGRSLIVVNDHDPEDVRQQLQKDYPGDDFSWHYLEKGPALWQVRVQRY